jgi:SAM-dependent methyltransferase
MTKQHAPAAARNKEPIREVLATVLPAAGAVLTIAEGTGEHAVHFARAFPALTWQPTDISPTALASIDAWRAEAGLPNVVPPVRLDVTEHPWPLARADAITCINMIHIAPWEATLGLFAGAARLLAPGALLFLYGPFRFSGAFTAPSNAEFDQSLRSRDPRWGVRDVDELDAVAAGSFTCVEIVTMPANNHSLIFRRS